LLPGGSIILLTDIPAFLNWGAGESFVGRLETMGEPFIYPTVLFIYLSDYSHASNLPGGSDSP
jgi:hypothetical protein